MHRERSELCRRGDEGVRRIKVVKGIKRDRKEEKEVGKSRK